METMTLAIEDMHCGSCVSRVSTVLSRIDGVTVRSVEVGSAEVGLDPTRVTPADVTSKLAAAGYVARPVEQTRENATCGPSAAASGGGCRCCGGS